eukprot:g10449.t1
MVHVMLSARLVKLIKIHLGFKCVEGVGHEPDGPLRWRGQTRTCFRYPSIFLHSFSMAVGGGVVVLPGAGVELVFSNAYCQLPQWVSGLMSHCPSVLVRAQVSVIL